MLHERSSNADVVCSAKRLYFRERPISLEMQRIINVLLLSIVLGVVGLAASATREPWGVYQGFPFAYSYPNPITCLPNPLNGCGYYYDPVMIILDYLFWLGTVAVGLSVISMLRNRILRGDARQPTSDQTPPGKIAPSN